jgi:hypothetical protein
MISTTLKTLSIIMALITIVPNFATAQTKTSKYLCVTDYAAGIIAKDGSFSAGTVNLPPEKQKFFVLLSDHSKYKDDDCFSKEQMEALKNYVEPDDEHRTEHVIERLTKRYKGERLLQDGPKQYAQHCLMGHDAKVNGRSLSSFDGFHFQDYGGTRSFTLVREGRFYMHELELGSTNSELITRGRCEPVN